MIRSMTGFGRSELKSAEGRIRVELKSTNHKFFEMTARLPAHLAEFEDTIRKKVSREVRRGKVAFFISSPDPAVYSSRVVLNESLAKEVFQNIRRLKGVLKLKTSSPEDSLLLREILRYPDVLVKDSSANRPSVLSGRIQKAIELALRSLNHSRALEGKALGRDFEKRLVEMKRTLDAVEKRIPIVAKEFRKSLEVKTKEFLKEGQIDHERLTLEAALYVKNSDISEEVTRFKSHVEGLKKALRENGELGRKIDFIAQEMTREANTMGAKSSDVVIANQVIQIKSAIEKIREQAQNVE